MKFSGLEINNGKANFVFYGPEGRRFEEPAEECKVCLGSGNVDAQVPVVDYVNGGFKMAVLTTCEDCQGYGYVVKDEQEES